MEPTQNPLQYAEDFYKRHFGGDIWKLLKNKWGRNYTQPNWKKTKSYASVSTNLAIQIEKILGKEVISAEDIIGVESANNSLFKTECLVMSAARARTEMVKNDKNKWCDMEKIL